MIRARTALPALVLSVLFCGACAFDPSSLPLPGAGVSGPTYHIRIEFSDVLNLPARAKVVANGAQIGVATNIALAQRDNGADHVVVDAEIGRDVELPAATTAALRQNTLLGDIHIALTTPPDGFARLLRDGDTIPVGQTRPSVRIEDTLAGIATFVQGGAVDQLQDLVTELNGVLPEDPARTAHIFQVLGEDVADLSVHLDQADQLLNGLTKDSEVMNRQRDTLAELLTDSAVDQVSAAVAAIVNVIGVLGGMAPVAHALTWLAPVTQSADSALGAIFPLIFTNRPLDLQAPSNLNALVAVIRDKLIPWVEHGPKVTVRRVNVVPAQGPPVPADDQVEQIVRVMRMIGVVR
ncbi:virulence factor Mce-like protein [Nocardia transvalensis]|uniref:Virulence factor Mce-like protein n=1 Tax=Nocardia transvalensis TaxID=37333 RepID=A0A7W9PAT7_9NOCA|nr:MlaD family protein [Nocardia transvalensis]MBB5912669.1 virulence factor Mce-like protein [Nocardia transvalensis]